MKILRNSLNDHIRKSVILRSIIISLLFLSINSFSSFAFSYSNANFNLENGILTFDNGFSASWNGYYLIPVGYFEGTHTYSISGTLNPIDINGKTYTYYGIRYGSSVSPNGVDFTWTSSNASYNNYLFLCFKPISFINSSGSIDLTSLTIKVDNIDIIHTSSPISDNLKNCYIPVGCALEFDMEGLTGNVTFNGITPSNNLGIRGILNLDLWYSQPVTSGAWYGSFNDTIDQISLADYPIITGINSTSTNGGLSAINFTPTKFSAIGNIQEYEFSGTISDYNRYIYIAYPYQVYSANGLATSGSGSNRNSGSLTIRIPDNIPARLVYLNTGATYATITASEYTVDENGNYIDSNGNIVTEEQIKNSQNYQEDLGSTIQSATQGFLDKLINSIIGIFEKPTQALKNLYNNGASYISYLQNLWSWIPVEVTSFLVSAFIVIFSIGIIKALL